LLHLEVVFHHAVSRVLYIVHNNIKVDFIRFISIRVKRLAHLDTVRMMEHFQNLQLSVLVALILEDFLDSHRFSRLGNRCFKHNSE
jgi:hypothetical protein